MMDVVDAMQRWLPIPEYRFVGGPADGQVRVVRLIETESGMMAPEQWTIADLEFSELPNLAAGPIATDAKVPTHVYRFVPRHRSMNVGHYEYEG